MNFRFLVINYITEEWTSLHLFFSIKFMASKYSNIIK